MYSVDKIATGSRRVRLVLTAIIEHFYLMPAACRAVAGLAVDKWLGFESLLGVPARPYRRNLRNGRRSVYGPVICTLLHGILRHDCDSARNCLFTF